MSQMDEQSCASVGMKVSLWFASPAALFYLVFTASKLLDVFFEQQQRQTQRVALLYYLGLLPLTLGALYISAALFGRKAGKILCRKSLGSVGASLIGICVALGCLVTTISVWIASDLIGSRIMHPDVRFSVILSFSSLVGIAALSFGFIPATLLGVLYGVIVRRRLTPAESGKA